MNAAATSQVASAGFADDWAAVAAAFDDPRRHPIGRALVGCRIPGTVKIEAKHRESRCREPFCQVAKSPVCADEIITDRRARMDSLARAIRDDSGRFWFTTIDLVRRYDLAAPIFYRHGQDKGVSLV